MEKIEEVMRKVKEEKMKGRGKGRSSKKAEDCKGDAMPPQTVDVNLTLMEGMQEI